MTTRHYFVEPLDVLMIRGNKTFGGAGQHGEAVMPPWPSLFAGAFRSMLLGEDGGRLARFVAIGADRGMPEQEKARRLRDVLGDQLFACLGTLAEPGDFRVTWLSLASGTNEGGVNPVVPLPADLAAFSEPGIDSVVALRPVALPEGIAASNDLPLVARLRIGRQVKPEGGRWLDGLGLVAHLAGDVPQDTLATPGLYQRETRLGIALDTGSRTVENGALYTTEAISFNGSAGFLVGIEGAGDLLPASGLLRLGGDGKGARYRRVDFNPPSLHQPNAGGRFRLILQTPGIFSSPLAQAGKRGGAAGWLPAGVVWEENGDHRLQGAGFSARLACAAIPRHEVISGWDLLNWRPKTAERIVPAGSVYWFDDFQGDPGKLAEWVAGGIWDENADAQRRAEGFNRAWLAAWPNN